MAFPSRRFHVDASPNASEPPLPVLAVCYGRTSLRMVRELQKEVRLELFLTRMLTPASVAFGQQIAAGVLLVTSGDPLAALTYARTAGLCGRIMIGVDRSHGRDIPELERLGDVCCLEMPFGEATRNQLISAVMMAQPSVEPSSTLLLDPIRRVVRYRDAAMQLTPRQFALLYCLSQRNGKPVRTREIFEYVWESSSPVRSRQIVDVYVSQLRRRLDRLGLPRAIRTLRGFGYALESDRTS